MRVDLHMHSTFSDGDLTPGELVLRALSNGLEAIALTDHDNDAGMTEFFQAAAGKIKAVRGIELSAYNGYEVHVLGYNCPITAENEQFRQSVEPFLRVRLERIEKMVEKLKAMGVDIDMKDLDSYSTLTPTRLHLARLLVYKDYVSNIRDAYKKFLAPGRTGFVPYDFCPPETAVQTITEAGGIAVLAHPGRIRICAEERERLIVRLKDFGLKGIEAHYPSHTSIETEYFVRLADKLDLFCTNGSDFHRAKGVHAIASFEDLELEERAREALGL